MRMVLRDASALILTTTFLAQLCPKDSQKVVLFMYVVSDGVSFSKNLNEHYLLDSYDENEIMLVEKRKL